MSRIRPLPDQPTTLEELWALLQDRLRTIDTITSSFDGDLGGKRLQNVGAAERLTDGVSVGYGDQRWAKRGELVSSTPGPPGPAASVAWTIENRTGVTGTVNITSTADRLFLRLDVVGNVTINFPAAMPVGGEICILVVQDATGNRRVAWASGWKGNANVMQEVAIPNTGYLVCAVVIASGVAVINSIQNGVAL